MNQTDFRSRRNILAMLGVGVAATAVPIHAAGVALAAPPAPDFGPAIDPYASYDGQNSCSPSPKPGMVDFMHIVLAAYAGTASYGISRDCGVGGQSEHKEGRAWDWRVSAGNQGHIANDLLNWLLATDRHGNTHALARRFGIMYMIWNRRIWKAYEPHAGWQAYTGSNPHTDHVHVSLSWAGANRATTWWTAPGAPPAPPPPPPSARRGSPSGFAASWAPDRLDVFGRGGGGVPYHNYFDRGAGAGWPDWHSLAGATGLSIPTVVSQYNGRLDVFAVGSDQRVRQWYFDRIGDNTWRGPGTLGNTTFAGPPTAVSWEAGRIDLFGRDTNGDLRHAYFQHGVTEGFTAWETLGSGLADDPTAVCWSAGRWDVFAVATNGRLRHWYFDRLGEARWLGPQELGTTTFLGKPAAVSWDYGRLDVFGRDTNNNLRHSYFQRGDTTEFSPWENLDGGLNSSPVAVTQYNGRLDVFYIQRTTNKLRQMYFDRIGANRWQSPGTLGDTTFGDTFDAVSWEPGRIDLFGVDTNHHMRHSYFQHGDTTGFSAWENLAGVFQ